MLLGGLHVFVRAKVGHEVVLGWTSGLSKARLKLMAKSLLGRLKTILRILNILIDAEIGNSVVGRWRCCLEVVAAHLCADFLLGLLQVYHVLPHLGVLAEVGHNIVMRERRRIGPRGLLIPRSAAIRIRPELDALSGGK